MNSERRRRIEELYQEALERRSGERGAFLESACPDPELRREVESLLRCEQRGDELLEKPPAWETALTPLEAGSELGPYIIKGRIGAGGMGEVYRARDSKLGRDVAIKALPPALAQDADRLARFKREAHLLASLNHPHIAAIHGLEEAGGQTFLVLELVEGEDLAARLKRGAIPVEEALALARQIADALEDAHQKGIIHRDLKPANIRVTPDGKVKVLDFGLARTAVAGGQGSVVSESESPTNSAVATKAGVILGTAAYMSPEQAGGNPVDKRADIWSPPQVRRSMPGRPQRCLQHGSRSAAPQITSRGTQSLEMAAS